MSGIPSPAPPAPSSGPRSRPSAGALALRQSTVVWYAVFTLASAALAAAAAPRLILLTGVIAERSAIGVATIIVVAGLVALVIALRAFRDRSAALDRLDRAPTAASVRDVNELLALLRVVTTAWVFPPLFGLAGGAVFLGPQAVDPLTAGHVALLGALMVAAAALSLHVLLRATFVRVLLRVPPATMRDVLVSASQRDLPRRRLALRIVAAVVTPVSFVALGSALIVNAHLRRTDQLSRQETARAIARATFDSGAGEDGDVEGALRAAAGYGFHGLIHTRVEEPELAWERLGVRRMTVPLDRGSAEVRFNDSTVPVLDPWLLGLGLASIGAASLLGGLVGRMLTADLVVAAGMVRALSDEAHAPSAELRRGARLEVVQRLARAAQRLALRFRVFARAQRRALEARESAARMRELFLASVSHDLKSPLNAILGFTELVRQDPMLTADQDESLSVIDRSGRELLALIETILDAARVQAGQLRLIREPARISDLLGDAIEKGRDLGGSRQVLVVGEVKEGIPLLEVDRVRLARAIATFIGYALRASREQPVRVRASPCGPLHVDVKVEMPESVYDARHIAALLAPGRRPRTGENRGLALSLGLARAIVELHGGAVRPADHGGRSAIWVHFPVSGQVTRPVTPMPPLPELDPPSSGRRAEG